LRQIHQVLKPRSRGVAATQGKIQDRVLVNERPAEVETRLIAGHYEGDLILGEGNRSAVGVLVERTTRYTMLCHLPQKDATRVHEAFTRRLAQNPLRVAPQSDLRSGQGNVPTPNPRRRPRTEGLLLSSPQPLGTRQLRKPERSYPPLSTQRLRPLPRLLSTTRRLPRNA